jgi:hypothetical protein
LRRKIFSASSYFISRFGIAQRHDGMVWDEGQIKKGACLSFTLSTPVMGGK